MQETRSTLLEVMVAFTVIAFLALGGYLFVGGLPDGSEPEELTEYSHEIDGIYAETEQETQVSGHALSAIVFTAGSGSSSASTKVTKYNLWEKSDENGFRLVSYSKQGNSFAFYKIADGSSPRIEKHITRTRLNSGFTRDKVEYWVYLDDEILEKQSRF